MKTLASYIKECLDVDNFLYKFDVWFQSDKKHLQPIINLIKDCGNRRVVQKDDIELFLSKNSEFKVKKFVDFFDEDVKRDEAINVDYIYLFTKIIENFITNFNLFNKVAYQYQSSLNGKPNVEIDVIPMEYKKEEEKN